MMKCLLLLLLIVFIAAGGNLLGQKAANKADILLIQEWRQIYDTCTPEPELIEKLKTKAAEIKADVYFAYWCSDSKNNVPIFLKIVDALNVPEFKVNFYALDKKATAGQKYYVENLMVERVPTFIFYVNDAEIGRIVENPRNSILQDIMLMVF